MTNKLHKDFTKSEQKVGKNVPAAVGREILENPRLEGITQENGSD